jgi:hypothetical protein
MSDTDPVLSDERWNRLTLSRLMHGLAEYAEDNSFVRLSTEETLELNKLRGKQSSYLSKLSNVGNFMGKSVGKIVDMVGHRLDALKPADRNYIKLSKKIGKVLEVEDHVLKTYLPDFSENKLYRWPGFISYRLALNHFVAVSLRVHSIYPQVPFNDILSIVAGVIITPAIAHNLSFVSKTRPELFRALVKFNSSDLSSTAALVRLAELGYTNEIKPPDDLSETDSKLFKKWILLLGAYIAYHPNRTEAKSQILKIVDLLKDYEDNLSTSLLWSNLEFIASGDFAMDELLVARVIEKGTSTFNSVKLNPIVSCAQSRFGLLQYIYRLEKDCREKMKSNPEAEFQKVEQAIKAYEEHKYPGKTDEETVEKLFGWAYVLSRRNLLGRLNDEPKKLKDNSQIRKITSILLIEFKSQAYLDRIFNSLTRESVLSPDSSVRNFGLLALRYQAGFKSNPRFIIDTKGIDNTNYIEEVIERIKKIDKSEIPPAIISMLKARNHLHKAFLNKRNKNLKSEMRNLNESLKFYSECISLVFSNQGIMDGEVAAWCIPEMITVFKFKQDHPESDEKQKKDINNLIDALALVGEYKFGIYFNQIDEKERIELGLKIRCSARFA